MHRFLLPLFGIAPLLVSAADISFKKEVIDADQPNRPWYKMAGDLDGDGLNEIIIGGNRGPLIAYKNPGWNKIQLAEGGWDGVTGDTGDIDGDHDVDIAMGGVWFENPGSLEGTWSMHRFDNETIHDVRISDVNQDGRMDIIGRNQSAFRGDGNKVFIFLQQKNGSWTKSSLDCPHGEGITVEDLDMDGDEDIILGNLWFENNPKAKNPWTRHPYSTTWDEPDAKVELADINRDGRKDIVLTPAELRNEHSRICWYEAPKDFTQANWKEHVIVDSIECVIHSLAVGDFNQDGDIDIAYAEMHQGEDPDEVVVMLNQNGGSSWNKLLLSEKGSHDIVAVDIDNDGDLDIFGANHAGDYSPVELLRNQIR
ncbi:MAG: VCBS repeat-containing protein [Verrucomicrobiae bacterium]|nr:VCBS repeat-containing protein [Verrucomicrobiae bacterium]